MKIIFENLNNKKPFVSVILIDWSVRDSAHILNYLNSQDIDRSLYEIIWIEYYTKHFKEIEFKLRESILANKKPILDKWIVMEIPNYYYYHKHLMHNVGILSSSGDIVVFCDSDSIVNSTFIRSIIKEFENASIVLHLDELRSLDRKFYPFNYPLVEEVVNSKCLNAINGRPESFLLKTDPFYVRNYGACMSCLRQDIIDIGGADEHIDYLGYICGFYEMTFRLVNAGKREVWSREEWLYHTWHPEASGWQRGGINKDNYHGYDDGRGMSSVALEIISSGRIFPLLENPFIRDLRLDRDNTFFLDNFQLNLPLEWRKGCISLKRDDTNLFTKLNIKLSIILLCYLLLFYIKHIFKKWRLKIVNPAFRKFCFSFKDMFNRFCEVLKILKDRWKYSKYLLKISFDRITDLKYKNTRTIIIFGKGEIVKVVYKICRYYLINIEGIYNDLHEVNMLFGQKLQNYKDGVVIVPFDTYDTNDISKDIKRLVRYGISRDKIVVII